MKVLRLTIVFFLATLPFTKPASASGPSISGISPGAAGAVGTSVTIMGANFGSQQGSSTVSFNGTSAAPSSWHPTKIEVPVPSAATTGNVVVTVSGLASNGIAFTVTTPANFAVSAANLNTARYRHTATVLNNGLVLIAGGVSASGQALTSAELYNPATGTFTATGNLSVPRWNHTATVLANGKVLIAGGINYDPASSFSAGDSITSAELYDPASGTFTLTGNMNAWRVHHTATLLPSGQVLIVGGFPNDDYSLSSPYASAELYNPATQTFTVTANSPITARGLHSATLVFSSTNNKYLVLLAGGYSGTAALSSAELYDPSAGTFTATGNNLSTARSQHTATLLNNGSVLIAGGSVNFNSTALGSAELYNPTTGLFTAIQSNLNKARYYHTATLLSNGQVLLAGGYLFGAGGSISNAELYDPTSQTFAATGNLNTSRGGHTASLLNTGMVLIAGGYSTGTVTGALASAELYQPSTSSLPNLSQITLSPPAATVAVGGGETFTATGTVGGSQQSLATVQWSSSNTAISTVSNDPGSRGTAAGLADGSATITACNGSVCGSASLTVHLQPTITGLSPSAGSAGTPVTITGNNFGSTQGSSTVTFNGTVAAVSSWNSTQIVVSVPSAATTGNLQVTVSGLASNPLPFTVTTSAAFAVAAAGLNTGRYLHTATLLNNGLVLIVGGSNGGNALSSAELYNPTTGMFSPVGSLNTARCQHTATLLNNGMVLIVGGDASFDNSTAFSSAELYNPATGTFTVTGNLNTARYSHTATLLNNGLVLIAGGYIVGGGGAIGSAELYDPATGTFSVTGALSTARGGHTATLLGNGRVLLTGGYNAGALSSAELYNPASGGFTAVGNMSVGRYYQSATLLNTGMVLIAGGSTGSSSLQNADLYNPANSSFTPTGALNTGRASHTATLLSNGWVLITGGTPSAGGGLASAELYNPANGMFTITGSLNTGRWFHTATLLNSGLVLIMGGTGGSGVFSSAELYQPGTVTPPNLVSIALAPANTTVASSGFQSFVATGTFSDNSIQTLTSVIWSSSNTSVATVSNDFSNYGTANALSLGSTTISACAGSICGSTTLTVNAQPVISSISPSAGPVGTLVTITGTGFGGNQGTSTVTFNGTTATPTSWTATSIAVPVPTGASSGPVVVTVNSIASNGVPFTFTVTPALTGFSVVTPTGAVLISSIANNQTIFSSQLGAQGWTIQANSTGSATRVVFYLTNLNSHSAVGSPFPHAATSGPFTVCSLGDCSGYFPPASSCGNSYLLQAIPYVLSGGVYVAGPTLSIAFSITNSIPSSSGITVTQDSAGNNITLTPPSGDNEIVIDDGPNFATPVLDQTFTGSSLSLSNIQSSGLVQGVTYNLKSKPSGTTAACVIQPAKWNLLVLNPVPSTLPLTEVDYLGNVWSGSVRGILSQAGVMCPPNSSSPQCPLSSQWAIPNPDSNGTGALATTRAPNYIISSAAEAGDQTSALNELQQHFDLTRMDELSQYYYTYLTSTASSVTLANGSVINNLGSRVMKVADIDTVAAADNLSTHTLDQTYINCTSAGCATTSWPTGSRTMVTAALIPGELAECALCNEIFFFSAAKLVRLVSSVPASRRTTNMTNFVQAYVAQNPTSFLVDDQILRSVFHGYIDISSCSAYLPNSQIPANGHTNGYSDWNDLVANYSNRSMSPSFPGDLECFSLFNNSLYVIGAAVEILGANANDSTLVPLGGSYTCTDDHGNVAGTNQKACLQALVSSGINLFKLKQNGHPTTDFNGSAASAFSYFDGDNVVSGNQLQDDSAFACYSGSFFPEAPCGLPGSSLNPDPLVSWDNSHYYILPIFLRTLFDNKKAINSLTGNFPAPTDLQYAAQQLVYNVLQNHTQASARQYPVFSNYMDGTDGWYRVGYHQLPSFGYAPAASCNATAPNPPLSGNGPWACLTAGEVVSGWGPLTPFSADLNLIELNLLSLAQATDPASRSFRDRHYFYVNLGLPFSFLDANQNVIYPWSLTNMIYLNADKVK